MSFVFFFWPLTYRCAGSRVGLNLAAQHLRKHSSQIAHGSLSEQSFPESNSSDARYVREIHAVSCQSGLPSEATRDIQT